MPLPTLSKESLSSSEQKKKDEEKTFSVTILVNENEKNKIVDLLHKAKSIISKKVEKVMGKKPKTGISNVDALQTVLENWLDKTESEEREEDRLLEQLIQGQEDQVETMLLDGKPVPVTFPTVPTVLPLAHTLARASSNMRGSSSSVGDRGRMADGTWYVFSSGDRHLFDVAEKREGGLGRVLFEIKPCKLDDGDLGGGGGFCGVLGGGCVACVGDEPAANPASYQETLASPTSTITV